MDRPEFLFLCHGTFGPTRETYIFKLAWEAWLFLALFQEAFNSEPDVLTHARNYVDVDTGLQRILEGHRMGFINQTLGQADSRSADSLELVGKDIKLVVKSLVIQDSIN